MRNYRLSSRTKVERELLASLPLAGPTSYEEAIARIEEAEREMDANEGVAWEDVMSEAMQKVNNYEVAVY